MCYHLVAFCIDLYVSLFLCDVSSGACLLDHGCLLPPCNVIQTLMMTVYHFSVVMIVYTAAFTTSLYVCFVLQGW